MSHWPAVKRLAHTVAFSTVQALSSERDESDTVTAMAGLSMQSLHRWEKYSKKPIDLYWMLRKIQQKNILADHQGIFLGKIPRNPWIRMTNKIIVNSENSFYSNKKERYIYDRVTGRRNDEETKNHLSVNTL